MTRGTRSLTGAFVVLLGLSSTACNTASTGLPAGTAQVAEPTTAASCTVDATVPAVAVDGLKALERSVRMQPLYTAAAAVSTPTSCTAMLDASAMQLEFRFGKDNWLRVKRDPRLEYTEYDARFDLPSSQRPVTILSKTEMMLFTNGCGIDWQMSENRQVPEEPGISETIFRGDVCNCQARIRKTPSGRVVGMLLRSAC